MPWAPNMEAAKLALPKGMLTEGKDAARLLVLFGEKLPLRKDVGDNDVGDNACLRNAGNTALVLVKACGVTAGGMESV
jgi:hypothetical protein